MYRNQYGLPPHDRERLHRKVNHRAAHDTPLTPGGRPRSLDLGGVGCVPELQILLVEADSPIPS